MATKEFNVMYGNKNYQVTINLNPYKNPEDGTKVVFVDTNPGMIIFNSDLGKCEDLVEIHKLSDVDKNLIYGARYYLSPNHKFSWFVGHTYNRDYKAANAEMIKAITTNLIIEVLREQGIKLNECTFMTSDCLNKVDIAMLEKGGLQLLGRTWN